MIGVEKSVVSQVSNLENRLQDALIEFYHLISLICLHLILMTTFAFTIEFIIHQHVNF